MNKPQSKPGPPEHLSPDSAAWWSEVVGTFELDSHHVKLLTLAAEAHDRCTQAREALAKYGMTYDDRFGQPRSRPEIAIERDSRLAFARLVRELGLQDEPDETRPPRLTGRYAGRK